MHGNHWSLILFTLLSQTAVGTLLIGTIVHRCTMGSSQLPPINQIFRRNLIVASMAMIMAALVSFFHLGVPLHAIYVLNNLAFSWLSREILSVILFTGCLCLVTFLHIVGFRRPKIMLVLEMATISLGLILVLTMSRVYMLPTVPVWNNIFTPLAFFGSTFLLGTATWTLIISFAPEITKVQAKVVGIFSAAFGTFQLSILIFHMSHVFNLGMNPSGNWMIGIRFLFLLAGTIIAVATKDKPVRHWYIWIFVLFAIAEMLGRYLFYSGYERIGI